MAWLSGLHLMATPSNVFAMVIGSLIGIFLGTLPGLGPAFALTLFVPLTFNFPAATALIFLVSMYTAAVYGGAISAVLVKIPGHPGNIATTYDGNPMAQQGRAGEAIAAIGVSGAIGGLVAVLGLALIAPLVVNITLKITPVDYFMLAVFGLSMVSAMSGKNVLQGMILGGLGFAISTVGQDPITGAYRFTFHDAYLVNDGISFSVMVIGLFAIGSAFLMIEQRRVPRDYELHAHISHDLWIGVRRVLQYPWSVIRGSIVGLVMGMIPGLGIVISNIASYILETKINPKRAWGKGEVVGVMVPEAADNATLISELIPAFTLGIPGAVTSALMLEAITVHGLQPGPSFFRGNPVTAAFFIAMALSQIVFAVLGIVLARYLAKGAEVPQVLLAPLIIVMGCVGAYAVHGNIGDIVLALIFGVIGYILLKLELPLAPIVVGAILGPLTEDNYRRTLLIESATHRSAFAAPVPIILIILSLGVFIVPLVGQLRSWFGKRSGSFDASI